MQKQFLCIALAFIAPKTQGITEKGRVVFSTGHQVRIHMDPVTVPLVLLWAL